MSKADFTARRQHLHILNNQELLQRFWMLADEVVKPLLELARTHTSPSIERSVLLRMGFKSQETQAIVNGCVEHGLLNKGAGQVVLKLTELKGMELHQAGRELSQGRHWDELKGLFGKIAGISSTINYSNKVDTVSKDDTSQQITTKQGLAKIQDVNDSTKQSNNSKLNQNIKLNVEEILNGLEDYRPRRKGWSWRTLVPNNKLGPFSYHQTSVGQVEGEALPAAKYFSGINPQPDCTITCEVASGRFEDDLRRMRMAAWHGADHMMVIRTAGQSHFDGLIEGTPEGVGGVPISRKQIRATRKALDLIEDEVGREINLHSYVSGVAGPEVAVLFAEEGVNGAHQDPQYNVLYRNINMIRSFVDAAEAKTLMNVAEMAQIDGAHNANATAREAWKVMPELLVQHAINCAYSLGVGMPRERICLSTVPPSASPAPALRLDLPYAIALRELFEGFRMRAQMNTKYIESDTREATVTHTLNVLLSRLTSSDIQSTITPDEGRNVPWHFNSVNAVNTAKQALVGMDGIKEIVKLKREGCLGEEARELKERAVLFLEEILAEGGYFSSIEQGFFVDSGLYPARNGDGILRDRNGGTGLSSVVERNADYYAPVCGHYGANALADNESAPCSVIGGCTLCNPEKIQYIDELDEQDNVSKRLEKSSVYRKELLRPEVEWAGDGIVQVTMFLPTSERIAEAAGLEIARQMNLQEPQIIHKQVMHPAEGTLLEIKGKIAVAIDPDKLIIPPEETLLSAEEIRQEIAGQEFRVVAATVGDDEHSVGMREIIDIKHGGIEGLGFKTHYLGTSVPVTKVVDAAIEMGVQAILISTIITHGEVHRQNMRKLHELCVEKGVRDKLILVGGGTQITDDIAKACHLDAGFGRGTKGIQVASFLVKAQKSVFGGRGGHALPGNNNQSEQVDP